MPSQRGTRRMRSSRREDFRSIHHSSGSIRETIFVSVLLLWGVVAALVVLSQLAVGQVLNQHDTNGPQDMSTSNAPSKIKGVVKVTVDMDKARTFMAPRAVAVNSSVSDAHLMDQNLPSQLRAAGVTTLRYPGLGYADTYHWATGKTTASSAPLALRYSGLGPNTDFGDFALMSDHVGTMVITVNYGSNQDGSGGGQPAEAAAWVAYANGNPADTKVIGKDSTGFDWQTVGYWASLRAAK